MKLVKASPMKQTEIVKRADRIADLALRSVSQGAFEETKQDIINLVNEAQRDLLDDWAKTLPEPAARKLRSYYRIAEAHE